MPLDTSALSRVLRAQDGVVARRQILDAGGSAHDIRRMRRRRELTIIHQGVYVDHTGSLSRRQREWAAVLAYWPAVLHRQSALDAHGMTRDRHLRPADEPVHVAVDATRTPAAGRPGVRVERVVELRRWVLGLRSPPCTTIEFALLKVASSRPEPGAIAVLADGCGQGLTTAERLAAALQQLSRLPGRKLLQAVLDDVASGAHSLLEQRYLRLVERAHGLSRGERQVRVVGPERVCFATSATDARPLSWSSTAASATVTPTTDGPTSTATWPQRSRGRSRFAWVGCRCSRRAASRRPSRSS